MSTDISKWRRLLENSEQINNIIQNPFVINHITSIDPAIWDNNQVKKSIIKVILNGIPRGRSWVFGQFHILNLFDNLKRFKCPWPELSIIQNYVNEYIENSTEEDLYKCALDAMKRPWPDAEPYIMKDARYAFYYARDVLKKRWPAAESYIMKDSKRGDEAGKYAFLYAENIIKGPWPEAEPYILKTQWADKYKKFVKNTQDNG